MLGYYDVENHPVFKDMLKRAKKTVDSKSYLSNDGLIVFNKDCFLDWTWRVAYEKQSSGHGKKLEEIYKQAAVENFGFKTRKEIVEYLQAILPKELEVDFSHLRLVSGYAYRLEEEKVRFYRGPEGWNINFVQKQEYKQINAGTFKKALMHYFYSINFDEWSLQNMEYQY